MAEDYEIKDVKFGTYVGRGKLVWEPCDLHVSTAQVYASFYTTSPNWKETEAGLSFKLDDIKELVMQKKKTGFLWSRQERCLFAVLPKKHAWTTPKVFLLSQVQFVALSEFVKSNPVLQGKTRFVIRP